jgi:hypothetical protein
MVKKVTLKKLLEKIENKQKLDDGKFIRAISYLDLDRILDIEFKTFNPDRYDELMAKAKYMMYGAIDIDQLDYLKSILPLNAIDRADDTPGRIKEYAAVTHHVWITDLETLNNDDLKTYKGTEYTSGYNAAVQRRAAIDDPKNFFIQSCFNVDKGAISSRLPMSETSFSHIIWTNLSIEEMQNHPELTNLRKVYNIDKSGIELPNFVVLNINDVMEKHPQDVQDLAHPEKLLPISIVNGLQGIKDDLLSVKDEFESMRKKHLFGSVSDVLRAIAIKNMGGLYFDFDQEIFDQDKVHSEQKKYNLFDLMKNYNCILGKEFYDFCTNCFISSAQPNSPIMEENWKTIYRNIINPESVDYIKYTNNGGDKVICQTGPTPITLAFIKESCDEDCVVPPGRLIHSMSFASSRGEFKLHCDIGHIGQTISSSTWHGEDIPLYIVYDIETGKGITHAEWSDMI